MGQCPAGYFFVGDRDRRLFIDLIGAMKVRFENGKIICAKVG